MFNNSSETDNNSKNSCTRFSTILTSEGSDLIEGSGLIGYSVFHEDCA